MAGATPCLTPSPLPWRTKTGHTDEEIDVLKETPLAVANKDVVEGIKAGRFDRKVVPSIILCLATW